MLNHNATDRGFELSHDKLHFKPTHTHIHAE